MTDLENRIYDLIMSRLKRGDEAAVGELAIEIAALAAQQDGASIGEFGGMKFITDKSIPNDVIEFHHPDGRVDRFRLEQGVKT